MKTTAQLTIDGVVLCRIAKLFEVLLLIEPRHPCPVNPLRPMLPHHVQRSTRLFPHQLKGVPFQAQSNELTDRIAARLVLLPPHTRFVRPEIMLVVGVGAIEVGGRSVASCRS